MQSNISSTRRGKKKNFGKINNPLQSILLTKDVFNKLKSCSEERGIKPRELAIEILEEELYYSEEDNMIFEQRTAEALKKVENNPNRKIMTKDEFLKELETW